MIDYESIKPVVTLQNIYVNSDEKKGISPLNNICLDIYSNELVCILGTENCGKSSLLSIIGGKLCPDSGEALLSGQKITDSNSDNPLIIPPFILSPWVNIQMNIDVLAKITQIYTDETHLDVEKYIDFFELEKYIDKKPYECPDDVKFFTLLSRCIIQKPKIIILDDPFFHFDPIMRIKAQKKLKDFSRQLDIPIIFSTRNIDEAINLGTRIVIMSKENGKIEGQFPISQNLSNDVINDIRLKIYKYLISE